MGNMESKVSAKVADIVAKYNGGEEMKKDLERLLELKGQEDIVPTELELDVKDVEKRYGIADAWEIIKFKTSIAFRTPFMWVVSKPSMADNLQGGPLFETLTWFCDYQDNRGSYSEEEQKTYDTMCILICNILSAPVEMFADLDYTIDLGNLILSHRVRLVEEAEAAAREHEDTIEDAVLNAEFEDKVIKGEKVRKSLEEAVARKKTRKKAEKK